MSQPAEELPEEAIALPVNDEQEGPSEEMIHLSQAARISGLSLATLHRRVSEGVIPARRTGRNGPWLVAKTVILNLAPKLKHQPRAEKQREADKAGENAAFAFERFAKGEPLIDVVVALRVDPDVVDRLFSKWIDLQQKQHAAMEKGGLIRCLHKSSKCSGTCLPTVGLCQHHASRSRALSDEELALLQSRKA
jgi:hypothetical protein